MRWFGGPTLPVSTKLSPGAIRRAIFGATFAVLVSPNSVLILCLALAGSSGNSIFTGAVLTFTTLAVCLLCVRQHVVLLPADYLFVALVLCMLSSFAFNGWTSNIKEYELLILSLAAYPACRFISRLDMIGGWSSFIWSTGIIVLLGTIATALALFQQWDDQHGKPSVFGFDAGGTFYLGSLSFVIFALATTGKLTARRTALVSSLIFLPIAIFAASQVRFTFVALAGSLCLAAIVSEAKQRKYVLTVLIVMFIAVAAGFGARHDKTKIFAEYAMEETTGDVGLEKPPSCYLNVNLRNSIAIRKALVRDALFLIPRAGWIGTGLDSFMQASCIDLNEVHNSILQAAVEFGWLGGALLFLLVVVAGSSLLPFAKVDAASRFAVCNLAFIAMLGLAHGRISRDIVLFALLGCAVGVKETSQTRGPDMAAVVA